ncbi:DMT family transporter [Brevundimonas goettingensis]|uniref:DMT family transporter n=1 Tax=Brevundimonas goettingensis TaxID=2774190 RepID=A0A975C0I7_9CAUL|nr:DMT family transporter [Brevundimonas goettingensis]QTC90719.1 DMT family transporter [Brevundimonas goettingensis]
MSGTASAPSGGQTDRIAFGIALRIASAGFFSIMSAVLKLAATHGVNAPEMLFFRALFGLPVVLVWVLTMHGGVQVLGTERPWAHLFRSALGIASILCTFHALTLLTLPDSATLGFTAPIFATILAALILKEAIGRHRWIAVVVGFIGVAVVLRPGTGHAPPPEGVVFGLLAALGTAGVTVTLRQLKDTEHVAAIVFWFFSASVVVGGLMLPFFGRWHDLTTYGLLAAGGFAGALAQLSSAASLKAAPVATVAPFDYLQIVGAVIFGWWLMNSPPSLNTLVGGVLIAASGLYTVWREHRRSKDRLIQTTSAPV